MESYQHVLVAADFTDHGERVAHRAVDIANRYGAKLSVVHIVESLPVSESVYGPVIPFEGDLTERLVGVAKEWLAKLGRNCSIPPERQWVVTGSSKIEIVQIAEEKFVDLIVVGSHGRHGLELLLGSTASAVLHHAKCDVLAVRLTDET